MYEKKQAPIVSPDLTKMQAVVIDARTTIYAAPGIDPKVVKSNYLARLNAKKL